MTTGQQFTLSDDLIAIWRQYVNAMLSPAPGAQDPPSKALVADEQSMRMITIACPMAVLMEHRVYDIHSIESLLERSHRTAMTGSETVRPCCHFTGRGTRTLCHPRACVA